MKQLMVVRCLCISIQVMLNIQVQEMLIQQIAMLEKILKSMNK